MRNLKFRVWDDLNKKWLLGYDYQNLGGFSILGEVMAFGEYQGMINSFSLQDWDKIIVMQFTGQLDKNGKEIYEGDIVKRTGTFELNGKVPSKLKLPPLNVPMKVFFHDGQYKITKAKDSTNHHLNGLIIKMSGIEVVGNKFQTPELLN